MESTQTSFEVSNPIQVNPVSRWDVYHRLQQLAIPCSCQTGQPLQVCVHTALDAIQVWSVVRQATAPRQAQLDWLETCWRAQL